MSIDSAEAPAISRINQGSVSQTGVFEALPTSYLGEINYATLDDEELAIVETAENSALFVAEHAEEEHQLAAQENLVFAGEMALLTHHIETEGAYVGEKQPKPRNLRRFLGNISVQQYREGFRGAVEKVRQGVTTSALNVARAGLDNLVQSAYFFNSDHHRFR